MESCLDEALVADIVERRIAPSPDVNAHMAQCARCRAWVSELARDSRVAEGRCGSLELAATWAVGSDPASSSVAELAPGTRVGRYVVESRIGSGGMGVVYAARDPELDRRVALKLVRPDASDHGGERRARIQREARAMARVSDPNVVAIYDVGELDERVFIAMELISGSTLRAWLDETPRSWREVLDVVTRAGRGLVAAHAAGLVHRDFKPDNVFVSREGRVCVGDFGLAREGDTAVGAGAITGSIELTQTGMLVGTPAYAAPEVLEGHAADASSDQVSFSITLYEALYRERPFGGDDVAALTANLRRGRVRAVPAGSAVPRWLRRQIVRGLSLERGERHASMAAMIDALDHRRRTTRRWLAAGAAALVALGAAVLIARGTSTGPACEDVDRDADRSWAPWHREAITAAFVSSGRPFAADAARRVTASLDTYAQAWRAMRVDACKATRIRGDQSDEVLSLRIECLDRKRQALHSLVELLSHAERDVVDKAVSAVDALPAIASCADTAALMARVRPPDNEVVRAQVTVVRDELARVRALDDAGKYRDGLALALRATAEARALPYRPVLAEALVLVGTLQSDAGDPVGSVSTEHEAVSVAEASRHDEAAADGWLRLLVVDTNDLKDLAAAHRDEERAVAAVERLGDRERQITLLQELGIVRRGESRFDEAIAKEREALALANQEFGVGSLKASDIEGSLADALDYAGRSLEGVGLQREVVAICERRLGADHPQTASALEALAMSLERLDEFDEARRLLLRAIAINTSLGLGDAELSSLFMNLGHVLIDAGAPADAIPYLEHVLEIDRRSYPPPSRVVATTVGTLGRAFDLTGRYAEARASYNEALAIQLQTIGPDALDTAYTYNLLGHVALAENHYEEALAFYEKAVAAAEKAAGNDSPDVATDLGFLARVDLKLGHPEAAVAPLERAIAIFVHTPGTPATLAAFQYELAKALWSSHGDRTRAHALATTARDTLESIHDDAAVARIKTWLATHSP